MELESQIKTNSRHGTHIIDMISKVLCKPIYRLHMQIEAEMVKSVHRVCYGLNDRSSVPRQN
jgi:hypothetical protein